MRKRAFALSFGGNLGDVLGAFQTTLDKLNSCWLVTDIKVSSVYKTEPWGVVAGGDFLNAAVSGFWEGTDSQLLELCQSYEAFFNSPVKKVNGARFLDIDILFIENGISTDELTLPHPRLHLRRFVLLPLSEVWGSKVAGLGKTASELLEDVLDESSIIFEGVLSLNLPEE